MEMTEGMDRHEEQKKRDNISLVKREGMWNERMLCEKINKSRHHEWRGRRA